MNSYSKIQTKFVICDNQAKGKVTSVVLVTLLLFVI